MYLHNTNEGTNFALYIWLKLVGGFHGLKMIVCTEFEPNSLIIYEKCITAEGHTTFPVHFTCFGPIKSNEWGAIRK
jgi:hypothetical protein